MLKTFLSYEVGETINAQIGTSAGVVAIDEIRAIYYRRPVPPTVPSEISEPVALWMSSEARRAWGGLLNSNASIIWVNHPLAISAASYKPEQLARAKRFGLNVPASIITNQPQKARRFFYDHEQRVIAKPIGHGEVLAPQSEDDRIIYTNVISPNHIRDFDRVVNCPTFFQELITKETDVRATVVGGDVFAVDLCSQENTWSSVDCRRENMRGMRYEPALLPAKLAENLVSLVRSYGLGFGAIDLIRDKTGKYWFLELNPAGQWAWLEQLGHARISQALIRILAGGAAEQPAR